MSLKTLEETGIELPSGITTIDDYSFLYFDDDKGVYSGICRETSLIVELIIEGKTVVDTNCKSRNDMGNCTSENGPRDKNGELSSCNIFDQKKQIIHSITKEQKNELFAGL